MKFNLLEEKWIPIVDVKGLEKKVDFEELIMSSKDIRSISIANPLLEFSIIRFICTLFYWKSGNDEVIKSVRKSFLEENPSRNLFREIMSDADKFDLFNEDRPFFQDRKAKNVKPCGSLFAEISTGTNIAHFQHGDDEKLRLCLPCTALGILSVVPWSQSGGAGLSPSIHNAPPIVAMAIGGNLSQTIGLNLVPLGVPYGTPQWSGHFIPTSKKERVPAMEAFTWNPRRILIHRDLKPGICGYCGEVSDYTIGSMAFEKNPDTKSRKSKGKSIPFMWRDPSAFYFEDSDYITLKSGKEEAATLCWDLWQLAKGKKLSTARKGETSDYVRARALVIEENPNHCSWKFVIPCTNPANNKTYDHRSIVAKYTSESLAEFLPQKNDTESKKRYEGWRLPVVKGGHDWFARAAIDALSAEDWLELERAAFCGMHEAPLAFDIFSGLYWGLREKKGCSVPKRATGWLVLKLLAHIPPAVRALNSAGGFNPVEKLLRVQPGKSNLGDSQTQVYPMSFPRGKRLEEELRNVLDTHVRKDGSSPIDWARLCDSLDQKLD